MILFVFRNQMLFVTLISIKRVRLITKLIPKYLISNLQWVKQVFNKKTKKNHIFLDFWNTGGWLWPKSNNLFEYLRPQMIRNFNKLPGKNPRWSREKQRIHFISENLKLSFKMSASGPQANSSAGVLLFRATGVSSTSHDNSL